MSDLIIDSGEFARQKKTRQGSLSLAQMSRVATGLTGGEGVAFVLVGGQDRLLRYTLDLALHGTLQLRCQRCLQGMPFELDVQTRFTLFSNEEKLAAAEDDDEDIEGLLIEREFDLLNLIEDEILLSLPYAPVHDACVGEAQEAEPEVVATPQKPNPFAVLAELKGKLQRG